MGYSRKTNIQAETRRHKGYRKKIISVALLLISFTQLSAVYAEEDNCRMWNTAFKSGEELHMNAYYNLGFIWLNAGKVAFTVKDTLFNGENLMHISAIGTTHKGYDKFFKVRDTFEIITHPETLQTHRYYRSTFEGPYAVNIKYDYSIKDSLIYGWRKFPDKPVERDTFAYSPCIYDVLTGIYAMRNSDLDRLKPGERFPIEFMIDMGIGTIYVKYLGKEEIKLKGGRKFKCKVFAPYLIDGTIFSEGEKMKVYITDDNNKLPVYVESEIIVGTAKGIISRSKNLRYPLSAETTRKK